MQKFKFF